MYPENRRKGTKTKGATSKASRADEKTVPKKIPITLANTASTTAPPTNYLTESEKACSFRIEARYVVNDRDEKRRENSEERKLNPYLREIVWSKSVKPRAVFLREGFSFCWNFLAYKSRRRS